MRFVHHLFLLSALVLFIKCSGQSGNTAEAEKLASNIKSNTRVPGEAPNANLFMKASIDGKPWTAVKLVPDKSIGSNNYRVTGSANGTTIGFYIYTPHIKVGDKSEFGEGNVADFITDDENGFYGGSSGTFTVTKLDDAGFEGTFYFVATTVRGSKKKYNVNNGSLRFPWANKK